MTEPIWNGPNTNSLSERLAAAHKRNAQAVENAAPKPAVSEAAAIAYKSGIKEIEGLVLRIEALERRLGELYCDVHDCEETNQREFERRYRRMLEDRKKL